MLVWRIVLGLMDIVNKVAQSGLVTLDLETLSDGVPMDVFDIKDFLHMEYVLKEADFRKALDEYDWERHRDHYLAVTCSNDAIVASWAYMLIAAKCNGIVKRLFFGSRESATADLFTTKLDSIDWTTYEGKRVMLKGCSDIVLPQSLYMAATQRLMPYAERIMYGEACSFVPIWRAPK